MGDYLDSVVRTGVSSSPLIPRQKISSMGFGCFYTEHRRYGYEFGDAVTGRDGEIIFGENDNGGHLWLYYPKIMAPAGV
jgi:hypothetical protein